jgi:hypothetical protein
LRNEEQWCEGRRQVTTTKREKDWERDRERERKNKRWKNVVYTIGDDEKNKRCCVCWSNLHMCVRCVDVYICAYSFQLVDEKHTKEGEKQIFSSIKKNITRTKKGFTASG